MTNEEYLRDVLAKSRAPVGHAGPGDSVRSSLLPILRYWGGGRLTDVQLSGSYAKATAVTGGTDVDLFLSLRPDTPGTLKELCEALATFLTGQGYAVRKQNVSLGIQHGGYAVDLVPGRQQSAWTTDHSIYIRRLDSWMKTNVQIHIRDVSNFRYRDIVILLKRWRQCQQIDFLSFALELVTMNALKGRLLSGLEQPLIAAFTYLRDWIERAALPDPANSNSNVADELTTSEKRRIASLAADAIAANYWSQVLW